MAKKRKIKNKSGSGLKYIILILIIIGAICIYINVSNNGKNPEDALKTYMSYIMRKRI